MGGLQEGDEAEARVQTRLELGRAREKAEEPKDEKEEESPSDPSKMKITRVFDFAGAEVRRAQAEGGAAWGAGGAAPPQERPTSARRRRRRPHSQALPHLQW